MNRYFELMTQFEKELKLRKYASNTIETYKSCLGLFLKAMNGKPKPLPIEYIKDFLVNIENSNYHKQFNATIHHFYKLVLKQPLNLEDLPYPRRTDYLPEIFSIQEISRLINCYDNLKHKSIISIFYNCALRISEVTNIQLSHINFDRSILRVKNAKAFKDRDVYISKECLVLISNYIQRYKPKMWLFEGQYGEQYSVRSVQQVFWQGVNKIGIKRSVRPHSLRHSRSVHLHEAKVDVKDISDFVGHYNIKTTTDFYLRLSKKSLSNRIAEADCMINNFLSSSRVSNTIGF